MKYIVADCAGVVVLASIKRELEAGQKFDLTDDQIKNKDISIAIKHGYIYPENAKKESFTEDKTLSALKGKKQKTIKRVGNDDDQVDDSTLRGWDMENQTLLNKVESNKKVAEQMEPTNLDMFDVQVIHKDNKKKTPKKKASVKKKSSKKFQKKEKSIEQMIDEVAKQSSLTIGEDNITFADKEQEIERINSHPILAKKFELENE
ncbi:MAG: hypothetical protein WDA06_05790 [Phenylobacterium sp.]